MIDIYLIDSLCTSIVCLHSVDLWSFGIIIYKMLTDSHPYSDQVSEQRLLEMIDAKKFEAVHHNLKVNNDCKALLNGLLDREDPEKRLDAFENNKWLE